jgi:hypothetical protein
VGQKTNGAGDLNPQLAMRTEAYQFQAVRVRLPGKSAPGQAGYGAVAMVFPFADQQVIAVALREPCPPPKVQTCLHVGMLT